MRYEPGNDCRRFAAIIGRRTRERNLLCRLLSGSAAIDHQFRPRHKGGLIRGQIEHAIGDILCRPDAAERDELKPGGALGRIALRLLDHRRINGAGMHGVAADIVFGILHRRPLTEDTHRTLGRSVGRWRPRAGGNASP